MLQKIEIMLYVNSVEKAAQFWKDAFGAVETDYQTMPDNSISISLKITNDLDMRIFDKNFVVKYSPEISVATPSLMLYTDGINLLHERISRMGVAISPIQDFDGVLQFNFSDYEENYFAVSEL
ncbi:VOC family protein [Peptostreptococcus equinus]|uniref:VOC domain-containing protein n=1 Tax=Peptostreptococcus equinus TaxID=3003601 RepID=A0ABY7JR80_9FIRM|nr:VOC family protein [Peptostreptococcus sp. CBA3647]WAW14553.1 hypothetical protein O0R46_08100 [Peptostreptococcus sp. CBA3647]